MWRIGLLFVLLTAACGSISRESEMATLAAENRGFVTEAARIQGTLTSQETEVMATSVAAETVIAQENAVNAVILSTVRAGDPPTVVVSARIDRSAGEGVDGATPDPSAFGDSVGGTIVETYVTDEVRDSDGCGDTRSSQFPEGTSRVFAVQRVQDIPANTLVSIEWYYGGATALEDNLVVTVYEPDLCIWFFVEPYSMGDWSVQFYSNGNPVGQRVDFNVGG